MRTFKYSIVIFKDMTEKRKRHFNVGETKSKILECILDTNKPVAEPEVRAYLSENFEEISQSTINKHLNYLKGCNCIEKVYPIEKSRFSYWDVENFEQLKSIRSEFKTVKLNDYEKAIRIVLNQNGYDITNLVGFFTHLKLLLSDSFFNACLETSMKTLFTRIGHVYNYKNAYIGRVVTKRVNESHIAFITRYPNIEISIHDFWDILNSIVNKYKEISSNEVFMEVLKEKIHHTVKETYSEAMDDDLEFYKKIRLSVELLCVFTKGYNETFFSLLFESYYFQDVLLGIASKEEIDFALETKANHDEYRNARDLKKDTKDIFRKYVLSDLKQASVVMHAKRQPLIFDENIFENQDNVYTALKKHFYTQILKLYEETS